MAIDLKTVGGRIRACRLETGMSQERLAELSDLSPPYVSHAVPKDLAWVPSYDSQRRWV